MDVLSLLPVVVAGYLLGSIPTGVLLARLFGWPDPRSHDSGHTGGLNAFRIGGIVAGVLVMLGDMLKGIAAVWLAQRLSDSVWAIPLGGTAAVAGHNWPVWLGFSGGMGLATGAGASGSQYLPGPFIAAGLWAVFYLILRHPPRASFGAAVTAPIIVWLLGPEPRAAWLITGVCAIIAVRHLSDWNRQYDLEARGKNSRPA